MKQLNLLKENNTPEYVTAEEQQLLHRLGNWNYFKTNPGNPWEDSNFKESLQNIKIKDIIYLESPSNEKLNKLGDYIPKDKVNNEWDTNFPVCINYKGNIYLLDGHHRVELAKRAGKSTIKVALKNVTSKYENSIEETISKLIKEHTKKLLKENDSLKELNYAEEGAKTSWELNDGIKITLKELVKFLDENNIPIININLNKIKHLIIDVERDNKRINAADLNFPIIISKFKDKYLSILDGNHRAVKSLLNNNKFIKGRILDLEKCPEIYRKLFLYPLINNNY